MEKNNEKRGVNQANFLIDRYKGKEAVVLDSAVYDSDVEDFLGTLESNGIKTLLVTNTSTYLMYNIHAFVKYGMRLDGLCEVDYHGTIKEGLKLSFINNL